MLCFAKYCTLLADVDELRAKSFKILVETIHVDACKKSLNHRDIIPFLFPGRITQIPVTIAKFITLFRNSDFVAPELCARIYRPSIRKNKPKTLVFSHRIRAFSACFREN
jgi:hypothetical protein